ncbi:MAG: signal peptide peptidase SppA [Erythrobacter sp.]|nr:signal peptide peptidase SppA [Erythrobacter sp.]
MSFIGKAWKVIVGIKDGLVLVFMLLFFLALFSALSASPNPGQVREGALYIDMSGVVVEENSTVDPFSTLLSAQPPVTEMQARDLIRAINGAASDERIKAVVLDLSSFIGGGQVHMQAIGEALDRVRQADKPVLTYASAYGDDHMHLAAHASEIWVDPLGGAVIAGPGGTNLYYASLLEKLKVDVKVFRVGEFKSAVEPYLLDRASEPARENRASLYGALWEEWQANVTKARPDIDLDRVTKDTVNWVEASSGNLSDAALEAGLVDQIGDKIAFGERVAEIVGEDDWSKAPGTYAKSDLQPFLADIGDEGGSGGDIAIVTIAGVIVDGDAGPGSAGGARISGLLYDALNDEDVKGLVVRVDSPGGSAMASEEIRRAIQRFRDKEIPVAVSFANVAASGGYWVATSSDRIFAQPETITGSIGVFAVIPTFERTAREIGINADGYRTTPLSGQPDPIAGLTPETDALFQGSVEDIYTKFLERVGNARGMTTQQVDAIAQGRVWDGGTARQNGLVDQFGGIEDAIAWTAGQAGIEEGDWNVRYLISEQSELDELIRQLVNTSAPGDTGAAADLFTLHAQQRTALLAQIARDAERLSGTQGVQAYCLECPAETNAQTRAKAHGMMRQIGQILAQ